MLCRPLGGLQKITFGRSRTKIPHNKFIVRLRGGTNPVEVWTGSTNFTASGFLGQTNAGHRVADPATANRYFEYWKLVKTDPDLAVARAGAMALTPNPAEVISERSIVELFSPRKTAELFGWYGRRMLDCANSVWFTAAFGVTAELVDPLAKRRDQMRFVVDGEASDGRSPHDLKLHDSIVEEVLALKLLRREQVRLAPKFAHKFGPRHLGLAVHTAMLAFHGRHQAQQTICRPPFGFILEQLPQGFRGRVETAVMTNLI
jgi:hypothetical protein